MMSHLNQSWNLDATAGRILQSTSDHCQNNWPFSEPVYTNGFQPHHQWSDFSLPITRQNLYPQTFGYPSNLLDNHYQELKAKNNHYNIHSSTKPDSVVNSPLWQQIKLPTNWMSDTIFHSHIRDLENMFLSLLESNKNYPRKDVLAQYEDFFRGWVKQELNNRKELTQSKRTTQFLSPAQHIVDLLNFQNDGKNEWKTTSTIPPNASLKDTESIFANRYCEKTSNKDNQKTPIEMGDNFKNSGPNFLKSYSSLDQRSWSKSYKSSWQTKRIPYSSRSQPHLSQQAQQSFGLLHAIRKAPNGTGLLGPKPGFPPTSHQPASLLSGPAISNRSLVYTNNFNPISTNLYHYQQFQQQQSAFQNNQRTLNSSIRLLGPGPTAHPPVYIHASSPYSTPPTTLNQPNQPYTINRDGPNLIGRSLLFQLLSSECLKQSPLLHSALLQLRFPQLSQKSNGNEMLAHQYVLEKLRCTCKD